MGIKAPRGYGIFTNPKKALYNRVYNRTTVSVDSLVKPKRTRADAGPGLGLRGLIPHELALGLVYGGVAFAIMVALLMWLGLSFKWAMILMMGAAIQAVAGTPGVVLALIVVGFIIIKSQ
ncbi:hypothetical protein [Methylobacterium sp. WL103]|uniref:hypothetical protein n=1 Tax=Methylobacterium sp. WL103 TaxID=2603891 RepID=UPI001AEDC017|nr:hypothetical protein [Methylobacterium sp. WL103]